MANARAKGEFETTFFGGPDNPTVCGGVNFSLPYTALPPQDLAPGTINTQSISGFLTSSPWIASSPFNVTFTTSEWVIGTFNYNTVVSFGGLPQDQLLSTLVVTNVAVYNCARSQTASAQLSPIVPFLVNTWAGADLTPSYEVAGQAVSFIQINGQIFMTGLMLNGIYVFDPGHGTFQQATNFVTGRWIGELAGRMVVGQCRFPGGGGTGTTVLPTVAWSGVGIYGQAWDLNPAHDVWNPANSAFFNGNIGGFNLLSDVPDQITGMNTVGQSIILSRNNGLTQQDPNSNFSNSGIQPFNWYHMWASAQGVGGAVGSVAQFGQTLIFRSSDNVYSLSLGAGLSSIGDKIISKINSDQRKIEYAPGIVSPGGAQVLTNVNTFWNFASIVQISGQLHYILSLNTYFSTPAASMTAQNASCFVYDCNLSEGSWHFWDMSQYFQSASQGPGFLGFSCPLVQHKDLLDTTEASGVITSTYPQFLLFGAFSSYGTLPGTAANMNGKLFHFVPFDYDFSTNPITNFVTLMYPALAVPATTIIFRGETLSLGHKLVLRRLRLQADNAPLPSIPANSQQQAQANFLGAGRGEASISPVVNMQGNLATVGQPIHFYYFDAQLSDDSVQPIITSVFSTTNAWQTLCAFRIASASLIGADYQATTQ